MEQQLETLLIDAREAYNSRAKSFENLTIKAGIVLATNGVVIGASMQLYNSNLWPISKIAYALLLVMSALLSFKTLFIERVYYLDVTDALADLQYNSGSYKDWLVHTIRMYSISDEQSLHIYATYNEYLRYSIGFLTAAIILLMMLDASGKI